MGVKKDDASVKRSVIEGESFGCALLREQRA
jgi:hypothetical protein